MKSKRSEIIQTTSTPSSINNIVRIEKMKAKEMFKELGYNITKDTKAILRYTTKPMYGHDIIDFSLTRKEYRLTGKTNQGNTHPRFCNVKKHQAIHQQMVELGWVK